MTAVAQAGPADISGPAGISGPADLADPVGAAELAARDGLVVLASAGWPDRAADHDGPPPALAGFVVSSFSPLVAEVAARCLVQSYPAAPADAARGERTAVIIVSSSGDVVTAVSVAQAVDAGQRLGPLLFFQAVPNAIAGYVAAKWGLAGPVVCLSPARDALAHGLSTAALLIRDGDADEALIVGIEQAGVGQVSGEQARSEQARGATLDRAVAVLVKLADEPEGAKS